MCLEERLFYKVISGLHANINLHLSKNYLKEDLIKNYTDIKDPNDVHNELDYVINATLAKDRVINHEDRLNNLFYLYSIVLGSLKKSENTLRNYDYETGNRTLDDSL